jgi:hypothetical protein
MIGMEIVFCLMFGVFGFFFAFFIRAVNLVFILLMAWIPFKVLEQSGLKPDWHVFNKSFDLIFGLGESVIEVVTSLINMASIWGMIFFIIGGMAGMLYHLRSKKTAH